MEINKIDLNSHIRSGSLIILGVIICTNFSRILSFLYPNQGSENDYWIGLIVFILLVLPAIIIHINYYLVNRGDVLEYSFERKEVTITHKQISISFYLNDIDFVEQSISFNKAANRSSVLPWDGYNHSVIHLKNGDLFTVTSLLVPDLNLPIEKEKVKIKRNVYRLAKIR